MPKKNEGFTLIETIIYITIFSLVVGSFVSFAMVISAQRNKQHSMAEINANKRVISELISYYVKAAAQVIEPASQATSSLMIFKKRDSESLSRIYSAEGRLYLDEAGATIAMTSDDCLISNLSFANLAVPGRPATIRMTGSLAYFSTTSVEYAFEEDFNINVKQPF